MISEGGREDAGVNQRARESELSTPRRGSLKTPLIIQNMFSLAGVTYTQCMRSPEKQLHHHLPVKWSRDWHTKWLSMALWEATLQAVASKDGVCKHAIPTILRQVGHISTTHYIFWKELTASDWRLTFPLDRGCHDSKAYQFSCLTGQLQINGLPASLSY